MVGADLEGLVAPHDEADLARRRLEDLDLASATLLPLGDGLVEPEELGPPNERTLELSAQREESLGSRKRDTHLEDDGVVLLAGGGSDLVRVVELVDRLELGVDLLEGVETRGEE